MDQGRLGGSESDAAKLSSVPGERGAARPERDRLQSGNLWQRLAVPTRIDTWSLTTLPAAADEAGSSLFHRWSALTPTEGGASLSLCF